MKLNKVPKVASRIYDDMFLLSVESSKTLLPVCFNLMEN